MDLDKVGMGVANDAASKADSVKDVKVNDGIKIPEIVALKSCHGKFLSAQPGGAAEWNRDRQGEWEKIRLIGGNGKYGLKSVHGKFLSAQPNGSVEWNRDRLDIWEQWEIEANGEAVALKSYHGKYLSAQPNGSVEANRDKVGEWETFGISEC